MVSDASQKWLIVIFVTLAVANPQFPMPYPMSMYPMMMQPPQPLMPVPVPIPISIALRTPDKATTKCVTTTTQSTTTQATTTTTTEKPFKGNLGVAIPMPMSIPMPMPISMPMPMPIPMPMPQPVQFAVPGVIPNYCQDRRNKKHPKCPACPPCSCNPCTPQFYSYCSPCHKKCRCRDSNQVPIPLPPIAPLPLQGPAFPMPHPGPFPSSRDLVMIPFPPRRGSRRPHRGRNRDCKRRGTSTSEEYTSIEENEPYDIYRRMGGYANLDRSDNVLVPELTYLSDDGEVRIRQPLNKKEANFLMDENSSLQNVHVFAGADSNDKSRVSVISDFKHRSYKRGHRSSKSKQDRINRIVLKDGVEHRDLGSGRKELVFKPPDDKIIKNLSVSFNVAR